MKKKQKKMFYATYIEKQEKNCNKRMFHLMNREISTVKQWSPYKTKCKIYNLENKVTYIRLDVETYVQMDTADLFSK